MLMLITIKIIRRWRRWLHLVSVGIKAGRNASSKIKGSVYYRIFVKVRIRRDRWMDGWCMYRIYIFSRDSHNNNKIEIIQNKRLIKKPRSFITRRLFFFALASDYYLNLYTIVLLLTYCCFPSASLVACWHFHLAPWEFAYENGWTIRTFLGTIGNRPGKAFWFMARFYVK